MATSRATKKTSDEIEVIENTNSTSQDKPVGEISDGIYTERDVELLNGVKFDVSVIIEKSKLPATLNSLLAEGNMGAVLVAQLTSRTRYYLDLLGATQEDLEKTIGPVISRAHAAKEAE